MNSRRYLISAGMAMGVALGAAGIAAATTGSSNPPAPVEQSQTPAVATQSSSDPSDVTDLQTQSDVNDEANGVDCEDGIIVATGAECDGGPSANSTDDKNEANDGETNDAETNDGGADQSGANGG